VIVSLSVLAPALGGSTALWAQALLALATGLLFLVAPPRRSLGRGPNLLLILLWLVSCAAFLPAQWFSLPDWRTALVNLGAKLPASRTPQPWLTVEALGLLFIGLVWAYYVFVQQMELRARCWAWKAYCIAILALAAAMTISSATGMRIPFWPETEHFGFFPNRNQTSNVLALGGIMIYAIGLQRLQDEKRDWWVWLYSLALIFWALIINYSRSGIILFFLGAIVWHTFWIYASRERRRPAIALAGLLLLAAALLIVGGATLARLNPRTFDALVSTEPGRLAIQHDALLISGKTPLLGIGLGNFGALFSPQKKIYAMPKVAIHPESDILWSAVELGWVAVLLLGLLVGWWIKQCLPFDRGSERRLRAGAFIAVCAFLLHGFFDVSGHRIGAMWPSLFLAGTAIHPRANFTPSKWISLVFRLFGVALIIIGTSWFASISGLSTWPTSARLGRLKQETNTAITERDFASLFRSASETVRIAPLNWNGYHARAIAEIAQYSRSSAKRDCSIAHYLMPFWSDLWLKEGIAWVAADDVDEAFAVWTEMLRRFPDEVTDLYGQIYNLVQGDADLLDRWRLLGRQNKKCLLVFFQNASPVEFRVELDRLLADDPELKAFDATEKVAFFEAWFHNGDKLELAEALREKSAWRAIGWKQLVRTYAEYGDYQNACATVREFASIPPVPEPPAGRTVADLELQARLYPTDVDIAAALCLALAKEDRVEQALARLQALHGVKGFPDYLRNLEAELWERKGEWGKAWNALSPFVTG